MKTAAEYSDEFLAGTHYKARDPNEQELADTMSELMRFAVARQFQQAITEARAEGYRKGQEDMRERAALCVFVLNQAADRTPLSKDIEALPIEPDTGGGK